MTCFYMKRNTGLGQVNKHNDEILELKIVIDMVSQTFNELFLDKFAFFPVLHYFSVWFTRMVRITRFDLIVSKRSITYDSFSIINKNF